MKVTSCKETPSEPEFLPVSVTFTFENQGELDAMGRLFNYTPFCREFREMTGIRDIRFFDYFKDIGGSVSNFSSPRSPWSEAITRMCNKKHTS